MLNVFTDGASRGNPGLAGAGVHITDETGDVIAQTRRFLGDATNNSAEYSALLLSLELLEKIIDGGYGKTDVVFHSDSQLLVNQISGKFRFRDERLSEMGKKFHAGVKSMKLSYRIVHVSRNENKIADKLANEAIDKREVQQELQFD